MGARWGDRGGEFRLWILCSSLWEGPQCTGVTAGYLRGRQQTRRVLVLESGRGGDGVHIPNEEETLRCRSQ